MRSLILGILASGWIGSNLLAVGLEPLIVPHNGSMADDEFVKVRCEPNGQTDYFYALGTMSLQEDGKAPRHVFNFEGVDISRCFYDKAADRWWLLSRKITLYRDPVNNALLRFWTNPVTGESLNVLHRTYDYQEFQIPKQVSTLDSGTSRVVSFDYNTYVPNPLADRPEYKAYAPYPFVQSSDAYKYIFPARTEGETIDPRTTVLSYSRSGPFEPWMKMGDRPGRVFLNYSGYRVLTFQDLPQELQDLISGRLPLFREAPACRLDLSIGTSWSRFEGQFKAYIAGDEFPLPAPLKEEACLN